MTIDTKVHESVMVTEVIRELHVKKARKYIDATLGTGGHTLEIVRKGGQVLGIEADPEMLAIALKRLEREVPGGDFKLVGGNFIDIDKISHENGFDKVSGVLMDLGVSNLHLEDPLRGFSFGSPESTLDMRLNHEAQGVKASDLLTLLRRDQLTEMFMVTLDPGPARWLTKRVLDYRESKHIETVGDLLEICKGLKTGRTALNPATLPFLALRIAVNSELDNLRDALPKAYGLLEEDGFLLVITFHSGEDRIVKDFFGSGEEIIIPTGEEVYGNQRARSAKMRVLRKHEKNEN
jgi:16S rRNA (cytosine1402-N4)-methyltransferase